MTWGTFAVLFVAGTIGAYLGILLTRRFRKKQKD